MSKVILDTDDFFQNDHYGDLMLIPHEDYCRQEDFEKYEKKISDLESKLAEVQNEKDELISKYRYYKGEWSELKQQLEEKEAVIEWQNEIVEGVKQEEELLAQKLKSFGVDCIEDLGKYHNQDKISFALEQLEKVKDEIGGKIDTFIDSYGDRCIEVVDLEFFIDNQIKQLKEGK